MNAQTLKKELEIVYSGCGCSVSNYSVSISKDKRKERLCGDIKMGVNSINNGYKFRKNVLCNKCSSKAKVLEKLLKINKEDSQ
jgi:hypothetical protein